MILLKKITLQKLSENDTFKVKKAIKRIGNIRGNVKIFYSFK